MREHRCGPLVTSMLIALAAMLALFMGACSKSSRAPGDPQIVSSIDAKLYQNPNLKALPVNVTSKQGVVTLSGTVNAPLDKLAVEDLARKTDGVKQVVDDLVVASASTEPPSAAGSSEQAAATPPKHHDHARHHASAAAENQASPAKEEAQNDSQPVQESAPQPQDGAQPAGGSASAPPSSPGSAAAAAPQPPPSPPPPQQVTIPAGTEVRVRMIDAISSGTAQVGQIYKASLAAPVVVDNQVVVPRDAIARVRVVDVQRAGHFKGQPLLEVELAGFSVNGTRYSVRSDYFHKFGKSRTKNSAEKVGGGAGVGALLGALIGHGKGAGIGAAIGAGAGAIDQRATHAQEVRIPSEARLDFTLKSPVRVTVSGGQ